jgi:hypothetical protein
MRLFDANLRNFLVFREYFIPAKNRVCNQIFDANICYIWIISINNI